MEKQLITRLKVTCGMQQMNQLQGMLQDYNAVKEETKEFETYLSTNNSQAQQPAGPNPNVDFTI